MFGSVEWAEANAFAAAGDTSSFPWSTGPAGVSLRHTQRDFRQAFVREMRRLHVAGFVDGQAIIVLSRPAE